MSTLKFEELYTIELLKLEDYNKCSSIWNMKKQKELAEKFYQELLSGNRITYVCKDGDLTFKIPCTFREFFDATQTNNKEEAEEYFGGLKLEDIDRKTSYISDNYNEEDFEGEIYFDTDGATNMWDTTVEKIVFESYKDGKFDLVRLEPGIYIGMSKDEAVQLIGEPDKTETLSGGASDYYYNHGNMELILYLDSDGIVEKISLDCDNG